MIVSNWQYKIPAIIANPSGVKTTNHTDDCDKSFQKNKCPQEAGTESHGHKQSTEFSIAVAG